MTQSFTTLLVSSQVPEHFDPIFPDHIEWFQRAPEATSMTDQEKKEYIQANLFLLRKGIITLDQLNPQNRNYYENELKRINTNILKNESLKRLKKMKKKRRR